MIDRIRKKIDGIKTEILVPIKRYKPGMIKAPPNVMDMKTGWSGHEMIIEDILTRFDIGRNKCIEFGVEFGYSAVVFSNFFDLVRGIDTFEGDEHSGYKTNHYERTKGLLSKYSNIELHKSDYRDWISTDADQYDFAHVDIVHSYDETFECGLWAAERSKCCVFHDTQSFIEVRRAVRDIARKTGKRVFNYPYHNGLGIVV